MKSVWIHDTNEALQRYERQHEDRHLTGKHGQETCELTCRSLHPLQGVRVEEITKLDIVEANYDEVNGHEEIRSWGGTKDRTFLYAAVVHPGGGASGAWGLVGGGGHARSLLFHGCFKNKTIVLIQQLK